MTTQGVMSSRSMIDQCHTDLTGLSDSLRTAVKHVDLNAKGLETVAK